MPFSEYKLSFALRGHEEDVRGVCEVPGVGIATASRDKTIRIWKSQNDLGFALEDTLVGHTHFVSSVAWVQSCTTYPKGCLVSGGMDKQAIVWDLASASILYSLKGHSEVVTDVSASPNGDIMTASQDKSAKVWQNGKCVETLIGHESAVQSILAMATGHVVTGSSDCTIRLWKDGECVQSRQAHSDTVRSLALMEGVGVVSGSHDGTVKLWDISGEPLLEMVGHTALVYSVAARGTEVASGSEDNTLKIWRDGTCHQTIDHPGCVWDIAYLANGDIVTGCSDGVARVWTRDPSRLGAEDILATYAAELQATKKGKTVGGVKVEDLPGVESLSQPGTKDGQHKIVREGDSGMAYAWSAKNYQWEKIGEVVDGPTDPLESRSLNGVTYDYVFDVDIGDGVPARKLPYNRGQNPYDVADQWLAEQELPAGFKEQVVQFILQNTGGQQMAPAQDNAFYDPYTGRNAYVPSTSTSSRPITANSTTPLPINVDPFTGTAATRQPGGFKHISKKAALLFDTAQFDGIFKKIVEFNSALLAENSTAGLAMSQADITRCKAIIDTLKDTANYQKSTFEDVDLALLARLIESWPRQHLFPILDLLRMLVLHPQAAKRLAEEAVQGKDVLIQAVQRAAETPAIVQNHLTGLRVAVNVFRFPQLTEWAKHYRAEILDKFAECRVSSNKNVRIAWSTLLLNFAYLTASEYDEEGQIQIVSAAIEIVSPSEPEIEVNYRALVAIGCLVNGGAVTTLVEDLELKEKLKSWQGMKSSKILELLNEIKSII